MRFVQTYFVHQFYFSLFLSFHQNAITQNQPQCNNLFVLLAYYDHVNGHSELVIEHVSKDDAGTYSCVAENRVGSIKSLGFVYVKGNTTSLVFC